MQIDFCTLIKNLSLNCSIRGKCFFKKKSLAKAFKWVNKNPQNQICLIEVFRYAMKHCLITNYCKLSGGFYERLDK